MTRPVPLELADGFGDLAPFHALDDLADEARFAFVGEMDHFIEEKLHVRLACVRYLASRGWTVFAEEWPADRGRRADTYLRTGDERHLSPIEEPPWFTSGVLAGIERLDDVLDDAQRRFLRDVRSVAPHIRWYGIDADATDSDYLAAANAAATHDELRPAMAIRERIMHRNLERIVADHPGEKIAVFGAALHLLRDDDTVEAPGVGAGPGGGSVRSLGHHIAHDVTTDPVLSIWMLHGAGQSLNPWLPEPGDLRPAPGTLDAALAEAIEGAALVDVRDDTGRQRVTQMHNLALECHLPDQVDAIVFVREVRPLGAPSRPPLLASGRAADVFDLGDGTVLRRYRSDRDCATEGRVMQWLHEQGMPVPEVHAVDGRDIVMERVDGPTMLTDLQRRPWRIVTHARLLADLQRTINELAAPEWFPLDDWFGPGTRVVHGDLHPDNVILTDDGPIVIDFSNTARGPADVDAALTYVLMSTFEAHGIVERVGQRLVSSVFRRRRGAAAVQRGLKAAARYRLADRNVTPQERARVHQLLAADAPTAR